VKTPGPVLLVEDDAAVGKQMAEIFEEEGFEVVLCSSARQSYGHLEKTDFAVVVTDLRLPDASGLEVIDRVKSRQPQCPILVMTAYATVDTAVEAMRRGAFHYLAKPFTPERLLAEVEKALEHGRLLREACGLRERLSAEQGLGRILGESQAIVEMRRMISEVAKADSTVLVTGETGTGKELVANAVHYESDRAAHPLIKVNCAALSENLLESELFGHEKGAFTGAERARTGRFERAEGGTLFLDEITEMGLHVQAKLLRVLQGEAFERVGGDEPLHPDVRVVAATNRDPRKAVEAGKLRQDLFFRLNVIQIEIPPLRARREDIPVLAAQFLSVYAARMHRQMNAISDRAMEAMRSYSWPGNVRELENVIERAVVVARGDTVEKSDLAAEISGLEVAPAPATLNLEEMEKRAIVQALKEAGGNKTQAAAKLGIFPSSLYKKMRRFGLYRS
jgi:two-component system response regulator HydG